MKDQRANAVSDPPELASVSLEDEKAKNSIWNSESVFFFPPVMNCG